MLKYTQWNNFFLISSQKIVCSNSQPDTFILWVPFLGTGRLLLGAPELPLTWCSCCYLLLSPVISCNCGAIPTHGGGCPGRADSFLWLFTSAFHCTQPSQRPVVDAGFNDINWSGFFCLFFVVCLGFVFSVYLFGFFWHILNQNLNWEKNIMKKTHQRNIISTYLTGECKPECTFKKNSLFSCLVVWVYDISFDILIFTKENRKQLI